MGATENARIAQTRIPHVGDEDALPADGVVTVSLDRFRAERDALVARGSVGVRLKSTQTAAHLVEFLGSLAHIALEFPSFNDGRPYSTARLLREKYGYAGELRATGDVLRDQLFFMQRCGFDVLELRPDKDAASALEAFGEFKATYQTAADARPPVYLRPR